MFFSLMDIKNVEKVYKVICLQIKNTFFKYVKKSYLCEEIISNFHKNLLDTIAQISYECNIQLYHDPVMNDIEEKYKRLLPDFDASTPYTFESHKKVISIILSKYNDWIEEKDPIVLQLFAFYFSFKLILIHAHIMDVFVYSKIFKKMKHHPKYRNGPDEYRNIILLAGTYHTQNTAKFLKSLDFQLINEEHIAENRIHIENMRYIRACANISQFTQPFLN
jgi:hypothetical protein